MQSKRVFVKKYVILNIRLKAICTSLIGTGFNAAVASKVILSLIAFNVIKHSFIAGVSNTRPDRGSNAARERRKK